MFEDVIAKMNQEAVRNEVGSLEDKRTYTVDEIQDILGISRPTAYGLVKKGAFPLCPHRRPYPYLQKEL